jgi:two-component system sensor kinase FixL
MATLDDIIKNAARLARGIAAQAMNTPKTSSYTLTPAGIGADTDLAPTGALANTLRIAIGFFALYLLLDQLSFIHPLEELNITPWNPQPALAVTLLVLYGQRWIGWLFVTVFAAEFVVRALPVPFPSALVLSVILTCGYAGIAWLLRGPFDIALDLTSRKDVLYLATAVVLGAGAAGMVYIGALCLGNFIAWSDYSQALLRFWIGDSIGMLVALPLLLLLANPRRRQELWTLVKQTEVRLEIALVVATLLLVFAKGELEQFKFFYLLFLPLIWIAARHGLAGAIGAVAVIQAGIFVSVLINDPATVTVIELQSLLLALILTGLFLGVTVDEWRFASERLARTQQLTVAGEMATALAHELNQPLTALSTYADAIGLLVRRASGADTPLIETAERIKRMANRSADIVARFRDLASTCASKAERIPIAAPLQAAIEATREHATEVGANIDVQLAADLPPLELDRERIAFVFQNLIANALDAIQDGSDAARKVEIRIRRDGRNHLAITVHDSGSGIRTELSDKVFEPFYSGKAKGMGLGLAISRSIIESHAGRIWAEPAAHGIFHIRLPL